MELNIVLDTNIIIDHLLGVKKATHEIEKRLSEGSIIISVITWGEVLVGCSRNNEKEVRKLLSRFKINEVSELIMEQAILIRQEKKIKMPDAIIWATAKVAGCGIVTRNTKDFNKSESDVFVPYTLKTSNK